MKKRAFIVLDGFEGENDIEELTRLLESRYGDLELSIRPYSQEGEINEETASFFSRPDSDQSDGWDHVREDEVYPFFVLYIDMEFDKEGRRIEDLWTERIEEYISGSWRMFCGNELSRKRIYIAPVRSDNLAVIKSIFRIFLNKQIDDIKLHSSSDVRLRYYLTALELPYRKVDSSERLIPACNNIYKLAESLEQDRLYLSEEVSELLPVNIRKKLKKDGEGGELYSYSFALLT